MWQMDGETMKQWQTLFLGLQTTADGDCSMKLKDTCSLKEKL